MRAEYVTRCRTIRPEYTTRPLSATDGAERLKRNWVAPRGWAIVLLTVTLAVLFAAARTLAQTRPEGGAIFQAKCSECHGTETKEAGLDLSSYESAMRGSEYGTVIEAGDADGSLLVEMVSAGEMPQDGDPLPEEEVALIRAWIEAGATNN